MTQSAGTSEKSVRVLIVDDDVFAAGMMRAMLAQVRCLHIEVRETADPTGEYDVFLIDNEFDGIPLAAAMAYRIRRANPRALIIAFSSTLDAATLKGLIRARCDGVCDKSDATDFPAALKLVQRYAEALAEHRRQGPVSAEEEEGFWERVADKLFDGLDGDSNFRLWSMPAADRLGAKPNSVCNYPERDKPGARPAANAPARRSPPPPRTGGR